MRTRADLAVELSLRSDSRDHFPRSSKTQQHHRQRELAIAASRDSLASTFCLVKLLSYDYSNEPHASVPWTLTQRMKWNPWVEHLNNLMLLSVAYPHLHPLSSPRWFRPTEWPPPGLSRVLKLKLVGRTRTSFAPSLTSSPSL